MYVTYQSKAKQPGQRTEQDVCVTYTCHWQQHTPPASFANFTTAGEQHIACVLTAQRRLQSMCASISEAVPHVP